MSQYFNPESLDIRRSLALDNLAKADELLRDQTPENRGALLKRLCRDHIILGLHAFYREGNQAALKHHFHVSSKLRLASAREPGGESFSSRSSFLFALLSDNEEVIRSYAHMEPHCPDNATAAPFPLRVRLLQLALRNDFDTLAREQDIAGKGCGVDEDGGVTGKDFYTLLRKRDQPGLEALLTEQAQVWESRVRRRGGEVGDALHRQFIAFCTVKVKLCWFKAIPVHVESPMVPMSLMPFRPLPSYEDIDGYLSQAKHTPASSRIMGRMGGWIEARKRR